MLPDDEFCLVLVIARGEQEPDDRVLRLARREAERSGVQLGEWLGIRRFGKGSPQFHVFLGMRE